MREKYVDTLAKLYEYATTVYSKKQIPSGMIPRKEDIPIIHSRVNVTACPRSLLSTASEPETR